MPRKDRRKIICRTNNTIDETATKGDHYSWKTQGPAEYMGTVGICSPLPQCHELNLMWQFYPYAEEKTEERSYYCWDCDHFSWKTQGPEEHMGTVGICAPPPPPPPPTVWWIEVKVADLPARSFYISNTRSCLGFAKKHILNNIEEIVFRNVNFLLFS